MADIILPREILSTATSSVHCSFAAMALTLCTYNVEHFNRAFDEENCPKSDSEGVSQYQDKLSDDLVSQISTMIRSGGKKRLEMALNSLRVAFQSDEGDSSEDENDPGLKPSSTAKVAAKASSSLDAVGTKLSPGVGTAIGAAWAKIRSDSASDSEDE